MSIDSPTETDRQTVRPCGRDRLMLLALSDGLTVCDRDTETEVDASFIDYRETREPDTKPDSLGRILSELTCNFPARRTCSLRYRTDRDDLDCTMPEMTDLVTLPDGERGHSVGVGG